MALQSMTAIATVTLQAAAPSVAFTGIPNTYRDLVLVMDVDMTTGNQDLRLIANSDSSSSYSYVEGWGTGSITGSTSGPKSYFYLGYFVGTGRATIITQLMDYAQTNKHKTALTRHDKPNQGPVMMATRWANTNAINSLSISPGAGDVWIAGSTFSLYGRIA